jgi:hypothetical protein
MLQECSTGCCRRAKDLPTSTVGSYHAMIALLLGPVSVCLLSLLTASPTTGTVPS